MNTRIVWEINGTDPVRPKLKNRDPSGVAPIPHQTSQRFMCTVVVASITPKMNGKGFKVDGVRSFSIDGGTTRFSAGGCLHCIRPFAGADMLGGRDGVRRMPDAAHVR